MPDTLLPRALLLVLLVTLSSIAFLFLSRRSGRVRPTTASTTPLATVVGDALGVRATFVQFSSEFCTPCRRTARVLDELVRTVPGVAHIELDATEHQDLVRRLTVLRTPTVFVLDGAGTVHGRSSGAMSLADARAALAVLPTHHALEER